MNGLGLLIALAAVGVDVGWESTSSGKLSYTIRIETVLIEKLREGSAIESIVEKNDGGLRKFRVAVGPKNLQNESLSATTPNEVEHGWRPNDSGGMDYYVQISLERLETLARGIPLNCEVHPEVPGIEKIYVFVGDTQLPRELPPNLRTTPARPRDLSTIADSRGGNVAPVSGTASTPQTPRYGTPTYGPQPNTQVNVAGANQDTGSRYGTQTPSSGQYGGFASNTMPVPQLNNNTSTIGNNLGYGNQSQYAPQQNTTARPQQPAPPIYSQPVAQTAALPARQQYAQQPIQAPLYAAPTQPIGYAAQTPPLDMDELVEKLAAKQAKLTQPVPVTMEHASKEPEEKSSMPLVMTTLGLFFSIGANAYLGWLAWSYFWRFRNVASDLSRARSTAFTANSAASH